MKVLIIDCFAGISGDMLLGALIDLGVEAQYLRAELAKLKLPEFSLNISKTNIHSISATDIKVQFDETKQPERNYKNIKQIISNSDLQDTIKNKSLQAFEILATAEAAVHNVSKEKIHFHEVGALDSIVDLVGSIIAVEYLKADKIYACPVPLGNGFVMAAHGKLPVPAPATLNILQDYPVRHINSGYEMTTPTGATLLKVLAESLLPENISFIPKRNGYGAGKTETGQWPNLLRLIEAETTSDNDKSELYQLETNIDDMNPEIFPYLREKLFAAKTKDVFITPVIMKKGRPGNQLSVIADRKNIPVIEEIIFTETTSIGIRKYPISRTVLERESVEVQTKFGLIPAKKICYNNKIFIRPEFEFCKKAAKQNNVPLQDIYFAVQLAKV